MLLTIKNKVIALLAKVSRSIAFLPVIMILCFMMAAALLIQFESWETGIWFSNKFESIIIKDADTARVVLSTIIGGLFSLVVFSFSMVMLLLNQASSNFSPRILPGLISDKRHQFILGVFIGTIVFCLLVLINVLPELRSYKTPGIAVLASLILCITSLGLFIYFLHSISQSIQINHIVKNLYNTTYQQLEIDIKKENETAFKDSSNSSTWYPIKSDQTGYIQSINDKILLDLATEYEMDIQVIIPEGTFIVKGTDVIATEKEVDEENSEKIVSCLQFHNEEVITMNYNLGFKQITEIILKAMSPGINDPSTAITGIDYLADLFYFRLELNDQRILSEKETDCKVFICRLSFEDLLYRTMSSIRLYIKHDPQVVLSTLGIFRVMLKSQFITDEKEKIIKNELNALISDAMDNIDNKRDKEKIQEELLKFI